MERNAIASGKRVDVHIIVRMYSCPDFDLGRGPTQSINKRSKGSLMTGIGRKGATGSFWLGLPAIWQKVHDWPNLETADFSPGQ